MDNNFSCQSHYIVFRVAQYSDKAVCWTTGVQFSTWVWRDLFSSPPRQDRLWDPPSLLSKGYRGFFPRGKLAEREADHSPISSPDVEDVWSYTSTPPYIFMKWCVVKHRISLHSLVFAKAQGQLNFASLIIVRQSLKSQMM
jgi:hypothetical protein